MLAKLFKFMHCASSSARWYIVNCLELLLGPYQSSRPSSCGPGYPHIHQPELLSGRDCPSSSASQCTVSCSSQDTESIRNASSRRTRRRAVSPTSHDCPPSFSLQGTKSTWNTCSWRTPTACIAVSSTTLTRFTRSILTRNTNTVMI